MNKSKVLPLEESTLSDTPIGELIAIFIEHLPDVDFPKVNATTLSELGCKVQAAHTAIVDLERQLHSAHEVRNEVEKALLQTSQSALGYARVYAEGDEELTAALSGIYLGKKRKSEPGTRKARKKAKTPQADLPLDSSKETPIELA